MLSMYHYLYLAIYIFNAFCRLLNFFSQLTFSKKISRNMIRVSHTLGPDQA